MPYGSPAQTATGFPASAGIPDYNKAAMSGSPQGFSQSPQAMPYGQPMAFGQGMTPGAVPAGTPITPAGIPAPGALPPGRTEESYVENILRLNLGKIATIYMTYENNVEWNAKIFKGRLEAAGRDHIIISDPATGKRYLLLTVNLDYISFDGELNYFNTPGVPLPR
ncbi:MAG: spore coat protein GerQ [Gorillibacterium sp.]|nr:spore coat protein GerQ [Gorillibacterium sp.]